MIRLLLLLLLPAPLFAAPAGFDDTVKPFVAAHCVACHGAKAPKGDVRLDTLAADFKDSKTAATWNAVREQLRDGTMPPKKHPAPPADAKKAVLAWLAANLRTAPPAAPVVRRLNRVEYENTLRDLLGLPGLDVKETLPADGDSNGFDTVADGLDISYVQMALYMEAADTALAKAAALSLVPEKPAAKTRRYYPQHCADWWHRSREGATAPLAAAGPDPSWQMETGKVDKALDPQKIAPVKAMGTFFHSDPAGLLRLTHGRQKIPVAGMYRLRVSAYGFQWEHGKLVPSKVTQSYSLATETRNLGYFDAPPDTPAVSTVTTWLEPTDEIHFNAVTLGHGHGTKQGATSLSCPGVAVEWLDVDGPLIETWPPAARTLLFGDLPLEEWDDKSKLPKLRRPAGGPTKFHTVVSKDPEADAKRLLKAFMTKACRRPVTDADVAPFLGLFKMKLAEPASFEEAMRTAQKGILTSAHFLFLSRESGRPDLYALAARLSYFLWSSTPDDALIQAAADGSLAKPDVLRAQSERLLNDPKARRFVENFTGQWLKLRDINSTQPDRQLYPEGVWESDIAAYTVDSMLEETRLTFAGMVRDDLSVTHVIDAPFSYVNEPLAKLYGINGVTGAELRKTAILPGSGRGGLLTQASVLKVSANGTTTSPVVRGVFVTSRLLGRPVPPPPPNITGIDPDVRGATTIREQLKKHSTDATCAACHAKMDPPGFALESFDVVGARRDRYRVLRDKSLNREGPQVDASGETAEGKAFKDVAGLKAILLEDPDQLARNLAVKLLTYATGRGLSGQDLLEVDEIVGRLRGKNYGTRALLHEVVQSGLMRGR